MKKTLFKYGVKHGGKIGKVPFNQGDDRYVGYYWGKLLKGKPHGKGICEIYCLEKNSSDTYKSGRLNNFWKKYSKNFMHKTKGYLLQAKYSGEWKLGKRNGYCEYTQYSNPYDEYNNIFVNKDGSPIIMCNKKGNFNNGKEEGEFEIFDFGMGWACIKYKNGKATGKAKKIINKPDLNNKKSLKFSSKWNCKLSSWNWVDLCDHHYFE